MIINDPSCFYPGDFTLFYAVTLEMMVRKLLHEAGYDQKTFGGHIDMSDMLHNNGSGIYPWENVESGITFIEEALTFLGCRVRWQDNEETGINIAVKLQKGIYLLSNNRVQVRDQLYHGPFGPRYEVKLGRRNTVFYLFEEEFRYDWRCLVNIVQGIIKLCKGGFAYGSCDSRVA